MKINSFSTIRISILAIAATISLGACGPKRGPSGNSNVPQPAKAVVLDSYLGKWYEFARYEAEFQKGCEAVTANYSLRKDGDIKVLNTCHQGAVNGKVKDAEGKAKVVDKATNAKLKVSFFGPFYGDYWVLDHADDYSWSIVGEPTGSYLWLLTRESKPSKEVQDLMLNRIKEMGYDMDMLRMTKH